MADRLKDWIKIDKRFENSVNLYLDLDNKGKPWSCCKKYFG